MATRFLRYDSDPILRKKCKAVLKVDDKIRQLLDDMLDTLLGSGEIDHPESLRINHSRSVRIRQSSVQ